MEPTPPQFLQPNYWLVAAFAIAMLAVVSGSDKAGGITHYAAMIVCPCGIVGAFVGYPLRGLAVGFTFLAVIAALMLHGVGC